MRDNDKNKVKTRVYYSRYQKKRKRSLCISLCAEYSRAEVINDVCGRADKINTQIRCSFIENYGVRFHPDKKIPCAQRAYKSYGYTAYYGYKYRGVHRVLRSLLIARAYGLRDNHVCAHGKPQRNVYYQTYKRVIGADRRKRFRARSRKLTYNNKVHGVEQQLKDTRQRKRQGKSYQLSHNSAARHIEVPRAFYKSVRISFHNL